ncbi:MAG: hypothetical protein MUO97_07595 [Dehalococcoidia bacterium]|nr:hypothetical protein [Dehalococcoidia bacterium]
MPKSWALNYHFIAYLDILGQSEELLKLGKLPSTPQEKIKAAEILHNTAGYIICLRKYFLQYYKITSRPTSILNSLPDDKRELAKSMRKIKADWKGFSDSITIDVPLDNIDEHCTSMNSIYASLFAICGISLLALASKKPLRGGIDIGIATPIARKEIYGPALVRAINLECKKADYPRILVGESVWDYLTLIERQNPRAFQGQLAKKHANESKSFITTDEDGYKILDIIGQGVYGFANQIRPRLIEDGYKFVTDAQQAYKASNDTKLFQRYTLLRNYIESRLHIWGIKAIS